MLMFGKRKNKKETFSKGDGFVKVAKLTDIKPGQMLEFKTGGVKVALANVEGEYYAFSPWCPHQGWPLWSGDLKGDLVRCYLHRWQFSLKTGENVAPGGVPVFLCTYPLKVQNNEIWVDITKAIEEQKK
jgi:nitrite reductase/ring-hydroxylating ferredoxin subunit